MPARSGGETGDTAVLEADRATLRLEPQGAQLAAIALTLEPDRVRWL
jgi:hypothetical protein